MTREYLVGADQIGAPGGVAPLDSSGKVPAIHLPPGGGGGGGGVDLSDDLGPFAAGKGILLTSPDGTKVQRLRLDNDGEIVTEDVDGGGDGGGDSPAVGIDPMTVQSLSWYLDAQSLTLTNGDAITDWDDRSPNDRHAFAGPGIANPPLYAAAGLNGRPAARFVRASDQRLGNIDYRVGFMTPATFVYVIQGNDFTAEAKWLNSPGGGVVLRRLTNGKVDIVRPGVAQVGESTNPLSSGQPHVVTFTIAPSGWSIFLDGVANGSGTNAVTWDPGQAVGIGEGMDGFLGAVVKFDAVLDTATRQGVEAYLRDRWDL